MMSDSVVVMDDTIGGVRERIGLITAQDRCDSYDCGAQARVRVTLHAGWLFFCAHHYNEKSASMAPYVLEVLDETSLILGG